MPNADQQAWSAVLAYLRQHHSDMCRQWFDEIDPLGIIGGVMRLRTPTDVQRRYLETSCTKEITSALQAVTGRLVGVRLLGPNDRADGPAPTHAATNGAVRPQHPAGDGLVINPDHTFDNFVIGPENRLAHATAVSVAKSPGITYNPLFIHGGVGLGKSHLLQAICLFVLGLDPNASILYVSCEAFSNQYIDAVRDGQMHDFQHRFRDLDMLVIDDIHFLAKRDRSQEEFFHTFNALHQAGRQIVLSSDAPPEEIPDLEARLVSRFQSGMVAGIKAPGFETRTEIAKLLANLRGIALPDDVAQYVATSRTSNVREIIGALLTLRAHRGEQDGQPISLSLARAALGDTITEIKPEVTIGRIIEAVVEHYSVKLADLQSKRRQKSIAHPRQVCMYLVRQHTRHSLEEIGGYFGGRDHTTVMHAVRTVEAKRAANPDLERVLEALERRCGVGGPD